MHDRNCCNTPDVSVFAVQSQIRVQRVRTEGTQDVANVNQVLVDVDDGAVDLILPAGKIGQSILFAVSDGTATIRDGSTALTVLGTGDQAIATFGLDCKWLVGKLVV